MFEAFKRLFSRSASPTPAATPAKDERTAASPTRTAPSAAGAITAKPGVVPQQGGDAILLPLNDILARLPNPLGTLVSSRPGGTFSLPSSVAMEQLRTGAVRIPFGRLRQAAPPGTFADNATHDATLVDLPLPLILAALGPAGLARRTDQRRMDVPEEVKGVFAAKGAKPGAPAAAAAAAPPPAPPPTPPPAPPPAPPAPKPVITAPPAAPKPVAPPPPAPKPVATPVAPPSPPPPPPPPPPVPAPAIPRPATPVTLPTTPAKPTTSIAATSAAPKPASPLPFASARPQPPPVSAPPPPPPPPAGAAPTSGDTITTTVEALCAAWPEAVREEIERFKLGSATISIPLNRLETGMKSGRVTFTWAELCGWSSVVPAPASAHGSTVVELPLKVVAPLFMAAPRAAKVRKVVSVAESVPDLFAGVSRPTAALAEPAPAPLAGAAPAPLAAPTVAPPAPPVAVSTPAPPAEPKSLAEILGQPSKTEWTPDEISKGIMAMPGVAGALLASRDGLLVAGKMPAPLKAEMLAAFLPQMLTHISGSTEEVELGKLRAMKLSADQCDCAVYKAGSLCLVVLSQPGQKLPEPALERIAGQLAQSNQ